MKPVLLLLIALLYAGHTQAAAPVKKWDRGAGTDNWADAANWVGDAVPVAGDSVVLDHSAFGSSYSVNLPTGVTTIELHCLRIYPSAASQTIFVNIPAGNTATPALRLTGTGFSTLVIGARGRLNNRGIPSPLASASNIIINALPAHGLLLDTDGYYYHGTNARDTTLLRRLVAMPGSTFEYDNTSSYTMFVFPLSSGISSISFHHLIFSGNASYGGTLAKNWSMVINGNLTVRNNAKFGVLLGAAGQATRSIRIRGNINASTASAGLFWAFSEYLSTDWQVVFDGTSPQTVTGNINLQSRAEINNPTGVSINGRLLMDVNGFTSAFGSDPQLVLINGILTTEGSNEVVLTMTNPTKLSGHPTTAAPAATAPSYINGRLRRAVLGTGTYAFPVGTSTHYQLCELSLTGLTGVSNILVQYTGAAAGPLSPALIEGGKTYDELQPGGYWEISPNAAPSGGSYAATLLRTNFGSTATTYGLVKRSTTMAPWTFSGSPGTSANLPGIARVSRTGLTSFSDFAIAFPSDEVFPLEWSAFEANRQANSVALKWITAREENTQHFVVQRRLATQAWVPLGAVPAAGFSQQPTHYAFEDRAPQPGIAYYRLQQVDLDGSASYSAVRSVFFDSQAQPPLLFPNPAQHLLHLHTPANNLSIVNQLGQTVHAPLLKQDLHLTTLDISQLPQGIYYVWISGAESAIRFVKN